MTVGNKKYAEPSRVLQSIVDDFGDAMQIGEEKDINEFKAVLVARFADAFHSLEEKKEDKLENEAQE